MVKLERFKSRSKAGELLAQRLSDYAGRPDVIVLALPRGGVPVGFAIAKILDVALDILMVRKLGLPGQEDYAMGAIASGGIRILRADALNAFKIPAGVIERVARRELDEIERREELYRGGRPPPQLTDQIVILVDDGVTVGSPMHAAVEVVRQAGPARIVVATPVCAPEACSKLKLAVDEIICLRTPEPFYATGMWYRSFSQTTDEEVKRLLNEAERQHSQQSFFLHRY